MSSPQSSGEGVRLRDCPLGKDLWVTVSHSTCERKPYLWATQTLSNSLSSPDPAICHNEHQTICPRSSRRLQNGPPVRTHAAPARAKGRLRYMPKATGVLLEASGQMLGVLVKPAWNEGFPQTQAGLQSSMGPGQQCCRAFIGLCDAGA